MIEWQPDPEFERTLPAERAIVGSFKLVVFSMADHRGPNEIIWEVFGPPRWQTFLATGTAECIDEAKVAAERTLATLQKSSGPY